MSSCTVCGSTPATKGTVWLVTGLILWLKWEQDAGPFCRTCGTAVARHYTNRTMLTGWWGLFAFFASLWAIGANLVAARRFASLPQPLSQSDVAGDANAPLKPGRPLLLRPGPYVSLLELGRSSFGWEPTSPARPTGMTGAPSSAPARGGDPVEGRRLLRHPSD